MRVPTFEITRRFEKDLAALSADERWRFGQAVGERFVPDLVRRRFRRGLRVRSVAGADGIFEMTWAPDGRATFQYGRDPVADPSHVIWRRVGGHAIFGAP